MAKEIKILHCVLDEKFIDSMIDLTQQLWTGCKHDYVCIAGDTYPFRFIKKTNLVKKTNSEFIVNSLVESDYNVVILHCFYSLPFKLINKIPANIKVIWFAWGYDIYKKIYSHPPLIAKELYHKRTKTCLKRIKDLRTIVAEAYCKIFSQKKVEQAINEIEQAINRVDYFSGVIPEEYDLIKENISNSSFRAKQLVFNYNNPLYPYRIERLGDPVVDGYDIQIGNSADCANNHLDIFHLLTTYHLNGRKILVPLSYAGTKRYKEYVIKEGQRLFGENFTPITDYMPLEKYQQMIASTKYSIFYLERQQAMGNIWASLWRGCLVFLSNTNPVYKHLINRGYKVFTIQNDLRLIEDNAQLSHEDIIRNRKLLISEHSYEAEKRKADVILCELNSAIQN